MKTCFGVCMYDFYCYARFPRGACSFLLIWVQGVRGSSAGEAVFMACSLGLMGLHLSKLRCVCKLPVGVIELDSSVVEISIVNSLSYSEKGVLTIT